MLLNEAKLSRLKTQLLKQKSELAAKYLRAIKFFNKSKGVVAQW